MLLETNVIQRKSPGGTDRYKTVEQEAVASVAMAKGTAVVRTAAADTVEPATTGDGANLVGYYFGRDRDGTETDTPFRAVTSAKDTVLQFPHTGAAIAAITKDTIVGLNATGTGVDLNDTGNTDIVVLGVALRDPATGNITHVYGRANQ